MQAALVYRGDKATANKFLEKQDIDIVEELPKNASGKVIRNVEGN